MCLQDLQGVFLMTYMLSSKSHRATASSMLPLLGCKLFLCCLSALGLMHLHYQDLQRMASQRLRISCPL